MTSPSTSPVARDAAETVRALVRADGVIIVGASDDPAKPSGRTLHYLMKYGYRGAVYPVNPNRSLVQGVPAYPSIESVPGDAELAVVVVPAPAVEDAVRALGGRGVRTAIVFASGFAEAGPEGVRAQDSLLATAREAGVRVLGPNCVGTVGAAANLTAAFMSGLDQDRFTLADDGVAFVTQSGAMGAFVLSLAQSTGLGLGSFVSTGNEADIDLSEVIEGLVATPGTSAVLGYVEGVRDPEAFRRALSRARDAQVPVVLMKVGRSERGAAAAQSHTGALVGADAVYDGLFTQYGVHRAPDIATLVDLGRIFAARRSAAGPRVGIVTLSGGAGVLMTDAAEDLGLDVSPWGAQSQAAAAAVLPPFATVTNPIDVTGAVIADPGMLRDTVAVALASPDTDVVVLMIGNLDREEATIVAHLREVAGTSPKPLVVVWVGGSGRPIAELSRVGVPTYDEPLRAMRAVAALVDFSAATGRGSGLVTAPPPAPVAAAVGARAALDEVAAKRLLAGYGVRTAREVEAITVADAVAATAVTGLPAVVKLLSTEVTHKSEHGVVAVGLADTDQVAEAAQRILSVARALGVTDRRLVVQEMVVSETELILGMRHDAVFGPVVALGIGGVLTEVAADVQVRVPPLRPADVESMVARLRNVALLNGPRGRPAVDRDALTRTVVGFSRLVQERGAEFESIEINPLLIDADGIPVAVDALAIPAPPAG